MRVPTSLQIRYLLSANDRDSRERYKYRCLVSLSPFAGGSWVSGIVHTLGHI